MPLFPMKQGNRIRLYQTLSKFIERGYAITFICNNLEDGGHVGELEIAQHNKIFKKFIVKKYAGKHFNTYQHGQQTDIDVWDNGINEVLVEEFKKQKYDAFLVNYSVFSKAFEFCPKETIKIVEMHDRLGGRSKLLNEKGIVSDFYSTTIDREIKYLERADHIICIKEQEADYLRANGLTKNVVTCYSFLEDKTPYTLTDKFLFENKSIGFIGSDNRVNRQCVASLFRVLLANLDLIAHSQVKLKVAGRISSYAKSILPSELFKAVDILGEVDKLEDYYKSITLSINPTLFSTGFKLKNVESLSYSVPLVSTHDASDGIPKCPYFMQYETPELAIINALKIASSAVKFKDVYTKSVDLKDSYRENEVKGWNELFRSIDNRLVVLSVDKDLPSNYILIICSLLPDLVKLNDQVFFPDNGFNDTVYKFLKSKGCNVKKIKATGLDSVAEIDLSLKFTSKVEDKGLILLGKSSLSIRIDVKDKIYLDTNVFTRLANGSTVAQKFVKPYYIRQYNNYFSKKIVVYFDAPNVTKNKEIKEKLASVCDDSLITVEKNVCNDVILNIINELKDKQSRLVIIDFADIQEKHGIREFMYSNFEPILVTNRMQNVNLFKRILGPETQFINCSEELSCLDIAYDLVNSNKLYSKLMLWSPYRSFAGY